MLDYQPDKGGYVIPMSEDMIKKAPAYDLSDLTKGDGSFGDIRRNPTIIIM
jgi:hypothetical protein